MTNTPAEVSPTIDPPLGERAVGAEDASKPGDVVGSVRDERGAVGLVCTGGYPIKVGVPCGACGATEDDMCPRAFDGFVSPSSVSETAPPETITAPTSPPASQSSSAVKALPKLTGDTPTMAAQKRAAKKKAKEVKVKKSREFLARERFWNEAINTAARRADDMLNGGKSSAVGDYIRGLVI